MYIYINIYAHMITYRFSFNIYSSSQVINARKIKNK